MKQSLLVFALLIAACSKPQNDSDLKAAFAASALKDPSSVQLRNVQANSEVICGEFNSKNSYGAYAGFEPFVFKRNIKDLWLGDSDNKYSYSAFWKECPNALELGLTGDSAAVTTDMNTLDLNTVDMNATAQVLEADDGALDNAANAIANAEEAIRDTAEVETEATDEPPYDFNNDGGE